MTEKQDFHIENDTLALAESRLFRKIVLSEIVVFKFQDKEQ